MDIAAAVKELIDKEKESALHKVADVCGYAESGPTFDPSGNYLCGTCQFRIMPDKCAVMKGTVSMETGGCIVYIRGSQVFDQPLASQFSPEHVIYTERPNDKGFGCKRCEYAKDEGIKRPKCEVWQMYVDPNACCYLNAGKDDQLKTSEQINAYGTSEGAEKGWDTRGRGKKDYRTDTGVHVGIFDRPEEAGSGAHPVTNYFGKQVPSPEQRLDIADKFDNAVKDREENFPIHQLTPLQPTVTEDRIKRASENENPKPVAVFYHDGIHYLVDGHHRVAYDAKSGKKHIPAVIYHIPDRVAASALLDMAYAEAKFKMQEIRMEALKAYGTTEGALKGWDTRGRGTHEEPTTPQPEAPKEEPPKDRTFYRGTTDEAVKRLHEEHGLQQGPHVMEITHVGGSFISSEKGKLYMTPILSIAKEYAILKKNMAQTEPGKTFTTPWSRTRDIEEFTKSPNGPPARPDAKATVISMKLPLSVFKGTLSQDPDDSKGFTYQGKIDEKYIQSIFTLGDDGKWSRKKYKIQAAAEERMVTVHVPFAGTDEELEQFLKSLTEGGKLEAQAEGLFHGIRLEGFTEPQAEVIRATISRVPPELMKWVKRIVAAPEMAPKHGRFVPETQTILMNPLSFNLRQRFGEGQGWIFHVELTMVHEVMHSIYNLAMTEHQRDEWRAISNWMLGTKAGQAPFYEEKRPGWPHTISRWSHRVGVAFPRKYSERNDDEDFSDSAAFYLLGKAHQIGPKKKAFIEKIFKELVKNYPKYSVESPARPYGEREIGWQMKAGEEKKITFRGMTVNVENDKGSVRSGVNKVTGVPWETEMKYPYGEIDESIGLDGDPVDVFVGPHEDAKFVYVVHQLKPDSGEWDEDKCMLGFPDTLSAKEAYMKHYDEPEKFFGSIDAIPLDRFKQLVMKKEPIKLAGKGET